MAHCGGARRSASASGQFVTSTPSTTYYLDLNPDGSWSFATSHSAVSNYLPICQATTNTSGNISAVTDKRPVAISLLSSIVGPLFLAGAALTLNSGALWSGNGSLSLLSQESGSANGVIFKTWSGSATVTPFSVGGQFGAAPAYVDNSGNYNGPSGGGIPMTRNGAAVSVPVYTGANSPVNPPTGSVWLKA